MALSTLVNAERAGHSANFVVDVKCVGSEISLTPVRLQAMQTEADGRGKSPRQIYIREFEEDLSDVE